MSNDNEPDPELPEILKRAVAAIKPDTTLRELAQLAGEDPENYCETVRLSIVHGYLQSKRRFLRGG